MDTMAIAAMSMGMSMAKTQQSASIAILKEAMGTDASGVLKMMEELPEVTAPAPSFGHLLDTYV